MIFKHDVSESQLLRHSSMGQILCAKEIFLFLDFLVN